MSKISKRVQLHELSEGERRVIENVAAATDYSPDAIVKGFTLRILLSLAYSRCNELRQDGWRGSAALAFWITVLTGVNARIKLLVAALDSFNVGETDKARRDAPEEWRGLDKRLEVIGLLIEALEKILKALKETHRSLVAKTVGKA